MLKEITVKSRYTVPFNSNNPVAIIKVNISVYDSMRVGWIFDTYFSSRKPSLGPRTYMVVCSHPLLWFQGIYFHPIVSMGNTHTLYIHR